MRGPTFAQHLFYLIGYYRNSQILATVMHALFGTRFRILYSESDTVNARCVQYPFRLCCIL